MKINTISKLENRFIKNIYTSENILKNKYFKLMANDFSQKHIIGPKFFELGMHYKNAKESLEDKERRLRTYLKDIAQFKTLSVNTSEKINTTDAIEINPNNYDRYLLFAHGGGMLITNNHSQELYKTLAPSIGILAPEYRGYGSTYEKVDNYDLRKTTIEDIQAGYEYLKNKGIKDENITLLGYCGGCTPAIEIAKNNPKLKQLILIAPYTSFEYVPATQSFQTYLKNHDYKSSDLENIKDVDVPTVIIHTEGDKIIPFKSVTKLSETAKNLERFFIIKNDGKHSLNNTKIQLIKKIVDENLLNQ